MRYVPNLTIGCYAMVGDNLWEVCSFLKGNGEVDLVGRGEGRGEVGQGREGKLQSGCNI